MKKLSLVPACSLVLLGACAAPTVADSSSHAAASAGDVDSLGCGDGVKSAPNAWFPSVAKTADNDTNLFEAVALMSSNLLRIESIAAIGPWDKNGDLSFPNDVDQVSELIFEVAFTPGVDQPGVWPTIHEDSIKNRDAVLLQLQKLGATVECNNILHLHHGPVVAGVPSHPILPHTAMPAAGDVDSLGCGDGVKSAPNAWFVSLPKPDTKDTLFQEIALMSANLFRVTHVTAANPATLRGDLNFPEDVSQTTALDFLVELTPGVDSIGEPGIHDASIQNRDQVLLQLKDLGVDVGCNNILPHHRGPIRGPVAGH
jgi:hypothetical protein